MLADLLPRRRSAEVEREWGSGLSMDGYADMWNKFSFEGIQYITPGSKAGLEMLSAQIGIGNAVVASCMALRAAVFSEARMVWQRLRNGRPGDLYRTDKLAELERPWPSATTGSLLKRMEGDATLYGNSYWVTQPGYGKVRLDPTKVIVATGSAVDFFTGQEFGNILLGYHLLDRVGGNVVATWLPEQVAHYAPIPDPCHEFRGVSWLSAVLPDVTADNGMTQYKHAYLQNAATPSLAIKYPETIKLEEVKAMKEALDNAHKGVRKAFKTIHFGLGADVTVIGSNFKDLDMSGVQGAGETRIAAAAGIPAAILGIKEGLQGSSLNTGNYTAARRRWGDAGLRPMWRDACGALQTICAPPDSASRLWYYDGDIPFLQEDVLDAAEINNRQAAAMRQLVDGGFDPPSVVEAVTSGDLTKLSHTNKLSVQLQSMDADQAGPPPTARDIAEAIQKIYLGVGTVITSDEAREIINELGAGLGIPGPELVKPGAAPATGGTDDSTV